MKPAPPRMSELGIADPCIDDAGAAHRFLVEDAPAVVEHGGPPELREEPGKIELGVLWMIGDHEHGVGSLEGALRGDGLGAELADDRGRHEVVMAAQLEACRP